MNIFKCFLNSFTSMVLMLFVMGSFGVFIGGMTMPLITYVGWVMLVVAAVLVLYEFLKQAKREKSTIENGVKHSVRDEAFRKQLGECRSIVKANKGKVLIATFVQTLVLVSIVGVMAFFEAKKGDGYGMDSLILLVLALCLGLLPLGHLRDYVQYYAYGFVYCGCVYLYQKVGGIRFTAANGSNGGNTLTGMWLRVNGDVMEGSYIRNVKRTYYETYFKRAKDPMQPTEGR